jgi:histidine triad (HIT) family protein
MVVDSCVFCQPNWKNLDIVERWLAGSVAILNPLDPVTEGHVLVIHRDHDEHAAATRDSCIRASVLMAVAAEYIQVRGLQANIITSIGPDATQSVYHTHVHVVPRRERDGLPLPWTPQHERKLALAAAERPVADTA